jgi:hypothetical protein
MLKMGLPMDAVKHALQRDGKDPSVMDLDPNKSVKSQMGGADNEEDTGPAIKDDPEYEKVRDIILYEILLYYQSKQINFSILKC